MEVKERPLDWFVRRIVEGTPTTFSRWGDGEWHSVFGRRDGHNCDGHNYFPKMGEDLKTVLTGRPDYVLGLQGLARRLWPGKIETWLEKSALHDLDWIDADVFHNASREGKIAPLLDALRSRPLVLVGPPHLSRLQTFLGYREFVTVPPKNSYLAWERLVNEVSQVACILPRNSVIGISAGMPGKLIADRLHRRNGKKHSIIDFGSLWDVYAGVRSRKYMHGMDVEVKE